MFNPMRLSKKLIQDFFDPMKKRSLKTFPRLMPKSLIRVNKNEVMIKADRKLEGCLSLARAGI